MIAFKQVEGPPDMPVPKEDSRYERKSLRAWFGKASDGLILRVVAAEENYDDDLTKFGLHVTVSVSLFRGWMRQEFQRHATNVEMVEICKTLFPGSKFTEINGPVSAIRSLYQISKQMKKG